MTTFSTFRDQIDRISPPWLRGTVASRYLYSIGVQLDILADQVQQGIKRRFPQSAALANDADALALIGKDRIITRGPTESNKAFGARLVRAIDDWKTAGSAPALLRQLQGFISPNTSTIRVVNNAGAWWSIDSTGTVTASVSSPNNWNWDGSTSAWSRMWVIIYTPTLWVVEDNYGNGDIYGDGGAWGTTASLSTIAGLQSIVATWKSAHSRAVNIIFANDPASFSPAAAPGAPMPSGTWGTWATEDATLASVPSRLATARYVDGPP